MRPGCDLVGASAWIDAVTDRIGVDLLLQVTVGEMQLCRLAVEVLVTTRCVNALEQVVLSQLAQDRIRIQRILEKREREDHFRLKRIQMRCHHQ